MEVMQITITRAKRGVVVQYLGAQPSQPIVYETANFSTLVDEITMKLVEWEEEERED